MSAVELGAAVRRLMNASVLTNADTEQIAAASEQINAVAAQLEGAGLREMMQLPDEDGMRRGDRPYSPVIGAANPLAPPLTVTALEDETVVGECTMQPIHEGPPGAVHGRRNVSYICDMVRGYFGGGVDLRLAQQGIQGLHL